MEAIATVKDGMILRWCYGCNIYRWTKDNVCIVCHNPIRDWVSELMYK